jgi:hypothetical protein
MIMIQQCLGTKEIKEKMERGAIRNGFGKSKGLSQVKYCNVLANFPSS